MQRLRTFSAACTKTLQAGKQQRVHHELRGAEAGALQINTPNTEQSFSRTLNHSFSITKYLLETLLLSEQCWDMRGQWLVIRLCLNKWDLLQTRPSILYTRKRRKKPLNSKGPQKAPKGTRICMAQVLFQLKTCGPI